MSKTKLRFLVPVCVLAVLAFSALASAGNSKHQNDGNPLFVPDTANNRVLIYDPPFSTDQYASYVLGQGGFDTATLGVSPDNLNSPAAFTLDHKGNLWVSDSANCRVVEFLAPPEYDGLPASLVIGEPDLNTACAASPTQTTLGSSAGITFDQHGNLWVADTANARVLRFSPPFTSGEAANLVLGQVDFTSGNCNQSPTYIYYFEPYPAPANNSLCFPAGVAFDSEGRLWVADTGNNRVLEFFPPFTNNMAAGFELGQPNFTSNSSNAGGPISGAAFYAPTTIAFDDDDQLWVTDAGNNRVLRFRARCRRGDFATLVLGQPNFKVGAANQGGTTPTASTLDSPQNGIVFDPKWGVFIGDTDNNRTLFVSPPYHNGMPARLVLGQPDFNSNLANQGGGTTPTAQTENMPFYHTGGPTLLALGMFGGLVAGRGLLKRLRSRQ